MRIEKKKNSLSLFTYIFMLLLTINISGCKEREHEEGEEKKAVPLPSNSIGVELSEIAQKSIGLKVGQAEIRQVEGVLLISGIVKPELNRVADVTTRAEGQRTTELFLCSVSWKA
jgi:hypothetical protein